MRILMVHPHDLLTIPWTVRMVELAQLLARKGCSVTVCHIPNGERRKAGVSVRRSLPQGVRYVELLEGKGSLLPNIRTLRELAAEADLVHLQKCFMTAALPALVAAVSSRLPLHYDWDDDESDLARYWLGGAGRLKISAYERLLPRLATTVSTASACLQAKARRFGTRQQDLFAVPVGADLEAFDRLGRGCLTLPAAVAASTRRLVFVGHLEKAHYGELVVEVFAEVAAVHPGCALIMVGGGSGQQELERKVAGLGLCGRVWFTGYVPHESVPAILSRADIGLACLPDTPFARAGSPIKVLEYLASGLAVVGTAVGEVPAMIGDCGLAVAPESKGEMARAVLELLADPERLETLKRRSRERVAERYSWERSADTLMAAYRRALSLRQRCRQ